MKRILIAGVPATGKTTVGNYMQEKFGFRHFDIESNEADPNSNHIGKLFWESDMNGLIDQLGTDKDLVITWGFVCDHKESLTIIGNLQNHGFKFVWLSADEPLARVEFVKRMKKEGRGDINAFNVQMKRIENLDLNIFDNPIIIQTLSKEGRKEKTEIAEEILEIYSEEGKNQY